MAKIEHELIPSSCSSTISTSNSTFHCIPFCLFSCSRRMATRRSTWARCSITERTPLVQVKLIFHIMELLVFEILSLVKFPHLQGQTMTFLGLRSSMQGQGTLFLAKFSGRCFKFFCEIEDIHRPADIYGGNGASWEAVPSSEKPLVRVRE